MRGTAAPAVDRGDWRILTDAAGTVAPALPRLELDLHPLLLRLADEPDAARGAACFQATLAAALVDWIEAARRLTGGATVVLSGGCLHNRLLADALHSALPAQGFEVLGAHRLSPGDAGLALGQAWVALHQLASIKEN